MPSSASLVTHVFDQAFSANINWASDTIKMALFTASPGTISSVTHYSDLANEVPNGSGYATGGATLGTKTHTVTAANSFATANGNWVAGVWIANTVAAVGDIVRPITTNGFLFIVVAVSGDAATGAVEPTWPSLQGQTVVDDVVTWSCLGESITMWSSASPTWAAATFTATNYAIYDAQTGVGSTEPVIVLGALSPSLTPVAGTATVTVPALAWWWVSPA